MCRHGKGNEVMKLFGKRLMLLGLLIVTIALASGVWNIAGKAQESAVLKKQDKAQLADLMRRQGQLTSDIENLKLTAAKRRHYDSSMRFAAKGEHIS